MATKHKQPKPLHSTAMTDEAPNENGTAGRHPSVLQQILVNFPDNDFTSPIVQASIDTNTKTMNLDLANCNLAVFGQSNTVHHSDCHLFGKNRGESEGTVRRAYGHVEQMKQMEAIADSSVQCFSKQRVSEEENHQKPKASSSEILVGVEPSLPVIRKQGFLNGPQCEEILKNLELLQDNGNFEHHMRFFNFCLQQCAEKGNKYMEVMANEQQIQNRKPATQSSKSFKFFRKTEG